MNCHTLMGEGAYYAPDLTKITEQRGVPYLQAFLKDPSKFYSEARDRRLMPNLQLSSQEIDEVIAFLGWVAKIDNQGWPPRPLLVSGATVPGSNVGVPAPHAVSSEPAEQGEALFRTTRPALAPLGGRGEPVGPILAGRRSRGLDGAERSLSRQATVPRVTPRVHSHLAHTRSRPLLCRRPVFMPDNFSTCFRPRCGPPRCYLSTLP